MECGVRQDVQAVSVSGAVMEPAAGVEAGDLGGIRGEIAELRAELARMRQQQQAVADRIGLSPEGLAKAEAELADYPLALTVAKALMDCNVVDALAAVCGHVDEHRRLLVGLLGAVEGLQRKAQVQEKREAARRLYAAEWKAVRELRTLTQSAGAAAAEAVEVDLQRLAGQMHNCNREMERLDEVLFDKLAALGEGD